MQRYTCTGRLTREPELRELPNGGSVCKLRLAVDDMARGRETGYINVSTFGKPGEAAAEVLSTGWLVAVDGRLEYHEWEQDGKTRHDYELIGNVEFLAAPRRNGEPSEPNGPSRQPPNHQRAGRPTAGVPPTSASRTQARHAQPPTPRDQRQLPGARHRPDHARAGQPRRVPLREPAAIRAASPLTHRRAHRRRDRRSLRPLA